MERKKKNETKVDIPMKNVSTIVIGGIIITQPEPSALFLSEEHEYTYVKTDKHTYSIYPYPLDN